MIHGIFQIYTSKLLQHSKQGRHNQTDCYGWASVHASYEPCPVIVQATISGQSLPGSRTDPVSQVWEETIPETIHTGILGEGFQVLGVCSVCIVTGPQSAVVVFLTFLLSSGLHVLFAHPLSSSSAIVFFFLLFQLSFHPLYMTITLFLLHLLVITCHPFLFFILGRIALPCCDLDEPILSHSRVYLSSHQSKGKKCFTSPIS